MREGLRSRTRLGKDSGGEAVIYKKKGGVKSGALVSGDEGFGAPDLSTEKKGEAESAVKEERNLDLNVSASENVDLTENENNESLVDDDADKKLNKGLTGVVRVLRSSLKRRDDTRSYDGENDIVLSGSKKGDDKRSYDEENDGVLSRSKTGVIKRSDYGENDDASSGKVSVGKGVIHKEKGGEENGTLVSDAEGLGAPNLSTEKKGEVECSVKGERDLDLNVIPSGDVDLAENGNDMSCLVDAGACRNASKRPIGVRVLRSRSKRGDDERSNIGENDGVSSGSKRGGDKRPHGGENDCTLYESKRRDDQRPFNGENGGASSSSEHGGFERIKLEENELLTETNEKERVMVKMRGSVMRKVKGKRGRPRKTELKEQDQLVDQSLRKRGRPPKVELKDQEQLVDQSTHKRGRPPKTELKEQDRLVDQSLRKRGRPPKTKLKEQDQLVDQSPRKRGRPPMGIKQNNFAALAAHIRKGKRGRPSKGVKQNSFPALAHIRKGKTGLREGKEGSPTRESANMNAIDDTCSTRSSGKDLKENGISHGEKKKLGKVLKVENDSVPSPSSSNTVNAPVTTKKKKNKAKQLVRDQIMERLSAAGWTVDYRPRNGRVYCDSVYVSLDGKTHWSITLAYNRLKKHYEAGDGEGKVYMPGFKFTPIPEEDFKILTKVINKKRKDSNKKRKDRAEPFGAKGGKTVVRFNGKVKKVKSGSGAGMSKLVKGKMKRKRSLLEQGNTNATPNRMPVMVRDHKRHKTQDKKQCALLVRNAKEEVDSEIDGYVPYSGKRTVLAWMIDLGTILQNGKVHYIQNSLKVVLPEGKITGDGIHCSCCNEIVTISDFGAHAGSKQSNHLENIRTEDGTSLLQGLLDSWNKQDESELKSFHFVDIAGEDPNDDTCGVCGDGGDLICCDGCPSTFHQSCLNIEKFPSGDWHCVYCCCKFCGLVGESSNQREVSDDFGIPALLTCHLCEQRFHVSCNEADDAKTDDSRDVFFCGNKCQELSVRLEMLLGVKHEIGDGFSWSFIRRSDVGFDASQIKAKIVESNSKLAVALSIMNECFMPYIDHRSGINLIRSILYNCGSNFKRLHYSGFVTAVLERGDEIISAASIRIHGNQLAEMPFIGTRYMYRRQGMCRRLLNAIEWALSSLNVELLVIPAISELRETWTSVFGFEPLELANKQITRNMNLLVFPHVDMLQKKISKHKFADENMTPTEGHFVGGLLEVAENCSDEVKISNEVVSIDKSAEDSAPSGAESIPIGSQIPFWTRESNDSADLIHHDSHKIFDSCVKPNCLESKEVHDGSVNGCGPQSRPNDDSSSGEAVLPSNISMHLESQNVPQDLLVSCGKDSGVCVPNAAEAELCYAKTADLRTTINPGDCQAILVSSDICERIADGVKPCCIGSKEAHTGSINGCGPQSTPNDDSSSGEAVPPSDLLVHLESQNISKGLLVSCEKDSGGVSVPNVGEAELCYPKTADLQTNINPGDCQSILVSSDIFEKAADGANESNESSMVAEANFIPAAGTELIPSNPVMSFLSELAEPDLQVDQAAPRSMNLSSELAEPDLQVDQTARSSMNLLSELAEPDLQEDQAAPRSMNLSSELAKPDLQVDQTAQSSMNLSSELAEPDFQVGQAARSSMNLLSELAEPDLQVGQAARSNASSSCSPNTSSRVDLHRPSAGTT